MSLSPITGTLTAHANAVIQVTTTAQKIGGPGGCSLGEAILAANSDSSTFTSPGNDSISISSACTAGSGSDTIQLTAGGVYQMSDIVLDLYNEMGATATPVITSPITIIGNGARLEHTAFSNMRAFSVGSTGSLLLWNVHIKGFTALGGDGTRGGGGGLGAGGAIYVRGGSLTVQESTFEGNGAAGGNGGGRDQLHGGGGGGGGIFGDGGAGVPNVDSIGTYGGGGGGGGGAHGSGGPGSTEAGGGGGGTVGLGMSGGGGGGGGAYCGGQGAAVDSDPPAVVCDGGGGGGGGTESLAHHAHGGADGRYGGGGGGGAGINGSGGDGGFGGGGGSGAMSFSQLGNRQQASTGAGGDGGFGGGAGAGGFNDPGAFGGASDDFNPNGGGGAGLGGAIFGDGASILVVNSTFTSNFAVRGIGGQSWNDPASEGADAGGAIFTRGGSLSVNSSTISGNDSTGSGAGIVVYKPTGVATTLTLHNTIVAGNGFAGGNHDECYVTGGVTISGASNLVTPHGTDAFTHCPGITQTGDPLLGALTLNAPGTTPTMALDGSSPAVDAGDDPSAPLNDQRGVARPQGGGPDIGAYESSTDTTPPAASPTQTPAANGNGWNNSAVTVNWNWADDADGVGIDSAHCTTSSTSSGEGSGLTLNASCTDLVGNTGNASYHVNVDLTAPTAAPTQSPAANGNGWNNTAVTVTWHWADNSGGSGIDSTNCTTSSTTSGEGAAVTPTANCSDLAGNQGSGSYPVNVDLTAPTVTCGTTPTFVLGSTSPGSVTGTVTDSLSQPVASPVSAAVSVSDLATAGVKSKSLSGYDKADNSTTVSCPYTVAYNFLGFMQPIPQSVFQRGSKIPVKFRLGDASGNPIPDAAASALLSPVCRVQVTFDGPALGCATYVATGDYFQFNAKVPKSTSVGSHVVGVIVSASDGSGTVNNESATVAIGR